MLSTSYYILERKNLNEKFKIIQRYTSNSDIYDFFNDYIMSTQHELFPNNSIIIREINYVKFENDLEIYIVDRDLRSTINKIKRKEKKPFKFKIIKKLKL